MLATGASYASLEPHPCEGNTSDFGRIISEVGKPGNSPKLPGNLSIFPRHSKYPIAKKEIKNNNIKTLVFVQDGILRSIPMAALYDG